MPLLVNLRHLEAHDLHLEGELLAEELDVDSQDEVIEVRRPLIYHLEAQKLEAGLLLQGQLSIVLECHCVRCLKSFEYKLDLKQWTCHLVLQGEEALAVDNDCVDLTPCVREDILLEFPQHPLCDPECGGLPKTTVGEPNSFSAGERKAGKSAWDELNKLKF